MGEGSITVNLNWPKPKNTKDVERFLGLANYHRSFIKNFAHMAVPLYQLTGKNSFVWGEAQQEAFENLILALTTAPVLTIPNETDPFILDTDASGVAVGAELLQIRNGEETVVPYASCSLSQRAKTILYYQIGIACRGEVHSAISSLFAGTQVCSSY